MTMTLTIAPTQWAKYSDIEDVEPINETDMHCLAEISAVLKKHNLRERFGVALLHKHFDMGEGERLIEFTDAETRTLTIRPVKDLEGGRTIQTIWELGDLMEDNQVWMGCSLQCWTNIQGGHSRSHQPNNN